MADGSRDESAIFRGWVTLRLNVRLKDYFRANIHGPSYSKNPAPIAHIKVVAVKKLVVGSRV